MPSVNMIAPPISPRPGAEKVLVPKYLIGIAFWIDGVPGSAVMVKVNEPSAMAPGMKRLGMPTSRNSAVPMG